MCFVFLPTTFVKRRIYWSQHAPGLTLMDRFCRGFAVPRGKHTSIVYYSDNYAGQFFTRREDNTDCCAPEQNAALLMGSRVNLATSDFINEPRGSVSLRSFIL